MRLKPKFIEIFCREYFTNRNITRSAMAAGWARNTAESRGFKVLENVGVQRLLEKMEQKEDKRHEGLRDKLMAEYKKIAFTDVEAMFTMGPDGRVEMIPISDMQPDQRALIANMKSKVKFNDGVPHYDFELVMHDKMKALEKIGQMIGAFKEVIEHNHVDFKVNKAPGTDSDEGVEIPEV